LLTSAEELVGKRIYGVDMLKSGENSILLSMLRTCRNTSVCNTGKPVKIVAQRVNTQPFNNLTQNLYIN